MKLEYAHQWIVNIIIDSYRIFPINDDGYSYFGLLSLDGFFQLCLQLSLSGKQEGGD